MTTVTLRDGPFAGIEIDVDGRAPLLIQTEEQSGMVARYRPTRDRGVYRFDGWDRVVATLPLPGTKP